VSTTQHNTKKATTTETKGIYNGQRKQSDVISAIQQKKELPFRTRIKIDLLVHDFLVKLGNDIHGMLCNKDIEHESDYEYLGLDSDRDTEAEVEAAIRLFPHVLSKVWLDADGDHFEDNKYPIQYLAFSRITTTSGCNGKAVPFLPLVARLAKESDLLEEQDRGGLLCQDV
jgi:hypothetical protein